MGTLNKAIDIQENVHDSIFFVGPPGSGKTTASALLLPGKRRLILDIDDKFINTVQGIPDAKSRERVLSSTDVWRPEHKMLSGENKIGITRQERFDKSGNKVPGTEGYVPPNPKGYVEITDYINSLQEIKPFPYSLVVLDPLTAVSDHLIYAVNAMHKTSVFTQPLWGVYRANMIELIKGFLSLPCHRLVIVHEAARENDQEQVIMRPSIMGSYRDEIAREFTEVYRFAGRMPNGRYMIRTIGNDKYLGRNTKGLPVECAVEDMLAKYI